MWKPLIAYRRYLTRVAGRELFVRMVRGRGGARGVHPLPPLSNPTQYINKEARIALSL